MDDTLPLRSRALQFLRELRGWTQQELADAAGVSLDMISKWERGLRIPSPKKLRHLTRLLGHTEATVREVLRLLSAPMAPQERWVGPVHFTAEQERELADFGDEGGRLVAFLLCQGVRRSLIQNAVDRERRKAQALRATLVAEPSLKAAVQRKREYQTWAVAELLCEESIRCASHNPQRALELAEAAVVVSELSPGEEKWKLRVQGYAQAHLGNAYKVLNHFDRADAAFTLCDSCLEEGKCAQPAGLINAGRIFGLKAALETVRGNLKQALKLLDEGLRAGPDSEKPYLLISKSKTLEEAQDYEEAINVLRQAAPLVSVREPRLLWALQFDLVVYLCRLRRHVEVETLLPEVQRLTIGLGNNLDLRRLHWLEGLQLAGTGHLEHAKDKLSQVLVDFLEMQLTYDAALVFMDLAGVVLALNQLDQIKVLVRKLKPILESARLHKNAKKALLLFRDATLAEAATVLLAQQVASYLRRSRRTPELEFAGEDPIR